MDRLEKIRVLEEAMALIDKGWTQGALAKRRVGDFNGLQHTYPADPEATCWCAMGAVVAVLGGPKAKLRHIQQYDESEVSDVAIELALSHDSTANKNYDNAIEFIEDFNDDDDMTQKRVLNLFTKTIRRLSP